MTAVTIRSDFGAQENKICHCFYFSPIYLPWSDGPDTMILALWMLNFKPTFSLSSFTLVKRLFSSSLLCATRVISSASFQSLSRVRLFETLWTVAHQASTAYLKLLIFRLAILTPVCALSGLGFCMMLRRGSLVGCHLWGLTELDMTDAT